MKKKYTITNILIILLILSLAFIYSLIFAPSIENIKSDDFLGSISKMNKSCLLNCSTDECNTYIRKNRGNQYFISIPKNEQDDIKGCIITFWGLSHLIMYFLLAFFVPSFYIELFFIGVAFEIYEYHAFDCHDMNDIYLNTIGILLGRYFSIFNDNNDDDNDKK